MTIYFNPFTWTIFFYTWREFISNIRQRIGFQNVTKPTNFVKHFLLLYELNVCIIGSTTSKVMGGLYCLTIIKERLYFTSLIIGKKSLLGKIAFGSQLIKILNHENQFIQTNTDDINYHLIIIRLLFFYFWKIILGTIRFY